MKKAEVLIVEDDNDINKILSLVIKKHGYNATSCFSGTEAQLRLENSSFDLVLLDIMLPGMDGVELLSKIREKSSIPVIVISAKGLVSDKIDLLRLGADDYIVKPFYNEEVAARIEVQLRKNCTNEGVCFRWKKIVMDKSQHRVTFGEHDLNLTNAEFDILYIMLKHPKQVFSKAKLYEILWNDVYRGGDNTISMHVSNIRRKISKFTDEEYIKTVWGIGFSLA